MSECRTFWSYALIYSLTPRSCLFRAAQSYYNSSSLLIPNHTNLINFIHTHSYFPKKTSGNLLQALHDITSSSSNSARREVARHDSRNSSIETFREFGYNVDDLWFWVWRLLFTMCMFGHVLAGKLSFLSWYIELNGVHIIKISKHKLWTCSES